MLLHIDKVSIFCSCFFYTIYYFCGGWCEFELRMCLGVFGCVWVCLLLPCHYFNFTVWSSRFKKKF